MKRLKSVYISVLTLVIFAAALLIGMQSDWWILEGRKTPLDGVTQDRIEADIHGDETDEHDSDEQDHEKTVVSGSSTVQDALNLGIALEDIENVLEGKVNDKSALIKDIVTERGLKFGVIKDSLNALIDK